jgi:UDP-N-acetyl-D-glucosamine dehydrogenase
MDKLSTRISVIGQGYVGLPLGIAANKCGYYVSGIDINDSKIESLNLGISDIEDIQDSQITLALASKRYIFSNDFNLVSLSEIVLVCVPTPLNTNHVPNLDFLLSAVSLVGENMRPESLIIIESTIEPGTTRNLVVPLLEKSSGMDRSEFYVAFSPERIDPTNKSWAVQNTPKLVAGLTNRAQQKAIEFYSKFIDTIVPCESLEIAETAKLLENAFRLINISFINEIAIFCQKLKIDINQVIKAASTKPYGFMPFYPSIGVGGHCIPVDPLYLANKAREIGASTRFIDLADQINQEMPDYFVGRAEEKLGGLKGKKVLVVGVSYKPNVSDIRETPVCALIMGLKQLGAQVSWHDDLVKEWNGEKSVTLSSDFDLAIIATPHEYLDLTRLGNVPILNTRGSI